MVEKNINGLKVYDHGEGERTFICAHGFPYDHTMWQNQVESLSSEYRVVTYDIRGLGQSDPGDGQYTMDSMADDLLQVVQGLELDKPILCGFSMGGYLSLRVMEKAQELFGGLVLVNTKAKEDNSSARRKRAELIRQVNEQGVAEFAQGFVPNCFTTASKEGPADYYTEALERARASHATGVKGCLLAMASRPDFSHSLKDINIPALVVGGTQDQLIPSLEIESMLHSIGKNAYISLTNKAAHMVPLEAPDFLNREIRDWLEKAFA
jgi:pimeloyl-ACP methyl ester carboxylesterase